MEIKDSYDRIEVLDLLVELEDLGVDLDELDQETTTLLDLVRMYNRLKGNEAKR